MSASKKKLPNLPRKGVSKKVATQVQGGRKAGGKQQELLIVK